LGTTAFGGGGVTVWGCFSFDYKLDLYVLDGNLTGQKYRDNVLAPRVVPHFDNHAFSHSLMVEASEYSACANVASKR
jgi:hypothetical protein